MGKMASHQPQHVTLEQGDGWEEGFGNKGGSGKGCGAPKAGINPQKLS